MAENLSISFPRHLLNQTHATIRAAFEQKPCDITETGIMGNINITSILTKIIQDTGRFVETYASDVLYGISSIRTLCEKTYALEDEIDEIFVFGLRRMGVDHGNFVMSRLYNDVTSFSSYLYPDRYYRRILAVRVHVFDKDPEGNQISTPQIECGLRNITDALYKLNPADIDQNGNIQYAPFENGNPKPIEKN